MVLWYSHMWHMCGTCVAHGYLLYHCWRLSGAFVVSGSQDCTIKLWSLKNLAKWKKARDLWYTILHSHWASSAFSPSLLSLSLTLYHFFAPFLPVSLAPFPLPLPLHNTCTSVWRWVPWWFNYPGPLHSTEIELPCLSETTLPLHNI